MSRKITTSDVNAMSEILADVARKHVLPRFRNLRPADVRKKGNRDLVTEVDVSAEAALTTALKQYYPQAFILGEEGAGSPEEWSRHLGEAEFALVVDPLDGTQNFAAGLPLFGMMIAVLSNGEVVASIIHDPIGGDWAIAIRGEGAWSRQPDGRSWDLRVSASRALRHMSGCVSWHWLDHPRRARVTSRLHQFSACFAFRCPAHEYRLLAGGHLDFIYFNKLFPWDQATGWLLHREAGGYGALLSGQEYKPAQLSYGLLCAPDHDSWLQIAESLGFVASAPVVSLRESRR
jgi:fructose-1,6-bisphosphatase/inositol monophosphatase family enzyme